VKFDFVKQRRSYGVFNMTAYQFFSIKNVKAKNAIQCSKTGYHITADNATVTF